MAWVRFGRYEALLRLGAGGMAEVFAARLSGEGGFHKLVAIKRMLPHLAGDSELVERFFDEARIAANIASPHVVRTLDVGRAGDGAPFLVMELVVGVTLADLFYGQREGAPPLPLRATLELLAQVADGLADAHAARTPDGRELSIVHRDVSPQNVLVGADGRARLTDFGIARTLDRQARTATGRVFGKLAYMAPEQMRGEPVTARSDVFALGVVAWEVISGRRLFGADERTDQPVPRLDAVQAGVPEEVVAIVANALEPDPALRCASAADFGRALRRGAHALGPAPDAQTLARYVADTGGRALAEVQRRIAIATAPDDREDVTRTGAATVDAIDPATRTITEPDSTWEVIDVDATIVSDALDGTVNVSGEQTWSSGDARAPEPAAPRDLHAAPTAPLEARSVATTVDPPRRSSSARWLVPFAVILLVAGVGLGAWLGLRSGAAPPEPRTITGGTGSRSEPGSRELGPARGATTDSDVGSLESRAHVDAPAEPPAPTAGVADEESPTRIRRANRAPPDHVPPDRAPPSTRDDPVTPATELEPGTLLGAERYPEDTR